MTQRDVALDAIKIDPEHYTVAFENERVRVLRIKYGPHERSTMHSHPDGVVVCLTDMHGKDTRADGTIQEFHLSAGDIAWDAAFTHQPENISDESSELIYVELKG